MIANSNEFPALQNYDETSLPDDDYNCIAWAAGITTEWHWPGDEVHDFIEIFEDMGYRPCNDGDREEGFEKVAIYADSMMEVTHMARQLHDGQWTSKLGSGVDIVHATPAELEGGLYGNVFQYMRRPWR